MSMITPMSMMFLFRGPHILKLIHRAALGATLDGSVAGSYEPEDYVRICRAPGATDVLLVAEACDYYWFFEGA